MPRAKKCPDCGGALGRGHLCPTVTGGPEPMGPGPAPGQVLAGRYELVERIGAGGWGLVFRAHDRILDLDVALKIRPGTRLEGDVAERIKREIRITREIDHPNVARVFDIGVDGELLFFTMRLVEGESLADRVERRGPLSVRSLERLASGLVAALAATHAKGFVHRDVKPANVLLSKTDEPVLVDFGVALETGDGPRKRRLTPEGFVIGTIVYLSPERRVGEAAGPPADLWALALTIAFAASGETDGVVGARRSLGALAEPLRGLLVRCLSEDPAARPKDGGALDLAVRGARKGTPFVGRSDELDALGRLVAEKHMVSVVGPPGAGKTRLVVEYLSRETRPSFFCDLVEARDADGVCASVARTLDVPLRTDPVSQIGAALAARGAAVVVLDNFEQLVGHAEPVVRAWRKASPRTRFVATSREALGLEGERVLELGPLGGSEAADLFAVRAQSVQPGWSAAPSDEAAVAELVRELDGLPLAIELAAARMRILAPGQILDNLRRRFELLGAPPGSPRGRRASLAGALDWSWELLDDAERAALAQCSAFRGGFDLAAAEAVLDLGPGAPPVLDVLESLHAKSLLTASDSVAGRRLGMLVTIREYAEGHLERSGALASTHARHAAHFLASSAPWRDEIERSDAAAALRRFRLDAENLLAVHRRATGTAPDAERATRAALALEPLLAATGPFAATLSLLDAAAAAPGANSLPGALRARALLAKGEVLRPLGRLEESLVALERARELAAGDVALSGRIAGSIGATLVLHRKLAEARAPVEAALRQLREAGDALQEAIVLGVLGQLCQFEGRLEEAPAHFEAACRIHRSHGHVRWEGRQTFRLAALHHECGRLDEARACYVRALRIHRETGDRWLECVGSGNFGILAQEQGVLDEARRLHEGALAICREIGNRWNEPAMIGYLGNCALGEGNLDEAEARFQEALGLARAIGDARTEGIVLGWEAGLWARQDRIDASRAAFEHAESLLAKADSAYRAVVAIERGHLDLALARAALAAGDAATAERLGDAVRARLDDPAPVSADVRLARKRLARALESTGAPRAEETLTVSENGLWFRPPGGKRVRLDRRRALPGILTALAARRTDQPGAAVSLAEMIDAGWPGEKMSSESALARIYMAVVTLRKLGLGEMLRTAGDGYLLDPDVPVVRLP